MKSNAKRIRLLKNGLNMSVFLKSKSVLVLFLLSFLLFSCGGKPKKMIDEDEMIEEEGWSTFSREVRLGQGSIFSKEFTNNVMDTIFIIVQAREVQQRLFDVNLIEKESVALYEQSGDKNDLIIVHQLRDLQTIDTSLNVPGGTYLLAFANYVNSDSIDIQMQVTFPD